MNGLTRILAALSVLACASPLLAQDPNQFEQGFNAYQSFDLNDFDSVNLANGNLFMKIPLVSYPQRL